MQILSAALHQENKLATPPSWQQSLAPVQHCNNYRISILKGHHQVTFSNVCTWEKKDKSTEPDVRGRKHRSNDAPHLKRWDSLIWLTASWTRVRFKSRSRTDDTADRQSSAILCSVGPELGRSGRERLSRVAVKRPVPPVDTRGRVSASFAQIPATI